MTTSYRPPRKNKSPNNATGKGASLAMRINRAANDLNPFLLVVAVGLLILNVTFYLGMSVSHYPAIGAAAHSAGYSAPVDSAALTPQTGKAHN